MSVSDHSHHFANTSSGNTISPLHMKEDQNHLCNTQLCCVVVGPCTLHPLHIIMIGTQSCTLAQIIVVRLVESQSIRSHTKLQSGRPRLLLDGAPCLTV